MTQWNVPFLHTFECLTAPRKTCRKQQQRAHRARSRHAHIARSPCCSPAGGCCGDPARVRAPWRRAAPRQSAAAGTQAGPRWCAVCTPSGTWPCSARWRGRSRRGSTGRGALPQSCQRIQPRRSSRRPPVAGPQSAACCTHISVSQTETYQRSCRKRVTACIACLSLAVWRTSVYQHTPRDQASTCRRVGAEPTAAQTVDVDARWDCLDVGGQGALLARGRKPGGNCARPAIVTRVHGLAEEGGAMRRRSRARHLKDLVDDHAWEGRGWRILPLGGADLSGALYSS